MYHLTQEADARRSDKTMLVGHARLDITIKDGPAKLSESAASTTRDRRQVQDIVKIPLARLYERMLCLSHVVELSYPDMIRADLSP